MASHRATLILAALGSAVLHAAANWGLAVTTSPLRQTVDPRHAPSESVRIRQVSATSAATPPPAAAPHAPEGKASPQAPHPTPPQQPTDTRQPPEANAGSPDYWPRKLLDIGPSPLSDITLAPPEAASPPEGRAVLELFINAQGTVDRIEIKDASAPASFVEGAKTTFQNSRFAPGIKDNMNVPSRIQIEVRYAPH